MKTRKTLIVTTATVIAGCLVIAGCGTSTSHDGAMPGMNMGGSTMHSPTRAHDMSSMGAMAGGSGLAASQDGYALQIKPSLMAGRAMPVTFAITKDGKPVTRFVTEQTKRLHLYLIRSDLTGFQHLHPVMAADGTWSVTVAPLAAGRYRIYTQTQPMGAREPIVLSRPFEVSGSAVTRPVPAQARSATVDGYTITLEGAAKRGSTLLVSFARRGKPVTELQPYLDTYAHVSGFRDGDLAFTHLHPHDAVIASGGGPDLRFMVEAPEPGTYRLFIQFMAGGTLHTAAITTAIS